MIDDADIKRVLADLEPEERAGGLRIIEAYVQGGRALARVADAMLNEGAVIPQAEALQAQANAELRARFITEYGAYTGDQVARLAGSRAENAAQYASRLKRHGEIVSVRWAGRVLYPRFQFTDDGRPVPVIAEVLRTFDGQLSEWQVVLWFVSANGHLDDRAPIKVMADDPGAVLQAAREEVAAVAE
jgi:hypothetical protein